MEIRIIEDSQGRIMVWGEEKTHGTSVKRLMNKEGYLKTCSKLIPGTQYSWRDKEATMAGRYAFTNGSFKTNNIICDEAECEGHRFKEALGSAFIEYIFLG